MINCMLFLAITVRSLAHGPRNILPPHWERVGKSMIVQRDSMLNVDGYHVVDDSGRFLYTNAEHSWNQWDFEKGIIRDFSIDLAESMEKSVSRPWTIKMKIRWGTDPVGTVGLRLDFAQKGLLAGVLVGHLGPYNVDGTFFSGTIGGTSRELNSKTGIGPMLSAGASLVFLHGLFRTWTEIISRVPIKKPVSGEIVIAHGDQVRRISLPKSGLAVDYPMIGGTWWNKKIVYLMGGKPGVFASKIDYRRSPAKIDSIPFPPGDCRYEVVLADGSICALARGRSGAPQFSAFIFDIHARKWTIRPELIIFGSSANGKYVAYGWKGQGDVRIAKVSG